jgi:hypothetical protein
MTTKQQQAIRYALMDLEALTKAEDWLEVCELKSAARETVADLYEEFEWLKRPEEEI